MQGFQLIAFLHIVGDSGGKNNSDRLSLFPEPSGQADAVGSLHHDIQKQDVKALVLAPGKVKGFAACKGFHRERELFLFAPLFDISGQKLSVERFVLHNGDRKHRNYTRLIASSSATSVTLLWKRRMEAGTCGLTGPVSISLIIGALALPLARIRIRRAAMISPMPMV